MMELDEVLVAVMAMLEEAGTARVAPMDTVSAVKGCLNSCTRKFITRPGCKGTSCFHKTINSEPRRRDLLRIRIHRVEEREGKTQNSLAENTSDAMFTFQS
jgi:hypothetical protein